MVRIGGSTPEGEHIKEWDYYTPSGEFRWDRIPSCCGKGFKVFRYLMLNIIAELMEREAALC